MIAFVLQAASSLTKGPPAVAVAIGLAGTFWRALHNDRLASRHQVSLCPTTILNPWLYCTACVSTGFIIYLLACLALALF